MAKLRRFFYKDIKPKNFNLEDKTLLRRFLKVLHFQKGQKLVLFDARDDDFLFEIQKINKSQVGLKFLSKSEGLLPPKLIYIYLSWLPGMKLRKTFEFFSQLGVFQIIPVISRRSKSQKLKNYQSLEKIVVEGAEIAGWSFLTKLTAPIEFNDLGLLNQDQTLVLAKDGADFKETLKTCVHEPKLNLLVGPEGGFTEQEVAFLKEKKFRFVSLGKINYKSEVAAVLAAALCLI